MLSARYLGPANYGLINYAASLCALMTSFCTLGTNDIMVNELVSRKTDTGQILGTTIFYRLCSSLLSICTICLFSAIANPDSQLTVLVSALYSLTLLFQCFETLKYWYQANLMSKIPSIIICIASTTVAIYRICLLVTGKSVIWFALSSTLDYAVIAILLLISDHRFRRSDQKLRIRPQQEFSLLRRSSPFIVSGLMVAIYGQMDKIMLNQLLGESAVGYYSAAVSISSMWPFLLVAIIDSARPIILSCKNDKRIFEYRLMQLYSVIIYVSIIAAILITCFSKWIIWLLYGADYIPAKIVLQIVTWCTAFSYLGVTRSIYLVANEKQKYEKWIAASGAICNLLLNSVLIPAWGINGAALATLFTQIFTNFIVGFCFKEIRQNNILILKAFNIIKMTKS